LRHTCRIGKGINQDIDLTLTGTFLKALGELESCLVYLFLKHPEQHLCII
jgi:hypothetical protein